MQLLARYTRIYALVQTKQTTPRTHVASPVRLVDFPSCGLQSEIHLGSVPHKIMEALKFSRAWLQWVLPGYCKSVDALRQKAADIPEAAVLAEGLPRTSSKTHWPHWFVTFCIDDHVELPDDPKQELLGVDRLAWFGLDDPAFLEKHTEALDQLAVQTAISVAPYRYRWRICDGPIIHLPTGIALRLTQERALPGRVIQAPSIENMNISSLSTPPAAVFQRIPMVLHFYLRSMTETDRISCFFDAFRGLEVLCWSLKGTLRAKADLNCVNVAASAPKAVQKFGEKRNSLRKCFATLALALNSTEADADLDMFGKLYKWRNDLAHGKRKLQPDDAPDEEAFALLHRYMARVT